MGDKDDDSTHLHLSTVNHFSLWTGANIIEINRIDVMR